MKMTRKRNKGITLVALVVTVIILLILAGISIASLTGNGLFEKAKLAKEKQENAQLEEDEKLGDYENKIGEYVDGSSREEKEVVIDGNERIIGTFYGETLYQKSFTGTTPTSTSATLIDVSDLNIDKCTKIDGITFDSAANYIPLNYTNVTASQYLGAYYNMTKKTVEWRSSSGYCNIQYYITIEYTKKNNKI